MQPSVSPQMPTESVVKPVWQLMTGELTETNMPANCELADADESVKTKPFADTDSKDAVAPERVVKPSTFTVKTKPPTLSTEAVMEINKFESP